MHLQKEIKEISGSIYTTGQTLVEQVSYVLSDKLYSYGTEEQELDLSISAWLENEQQNSAGIIPAFSRMQTRSGAASMILGNIFSRDAALVKSNSPASVIATSSSLIAMKPVLDQLSLLYGSATPLVAHVSSLDLSPVTSNFVSDYTRALAISREGGYAVVSSSSIQDIQHMALFASVLSSELPTIHAYDGLRVAREYTRVANVLDESTIKRSYANVLQNQESLGKKADSYQRVTNLLQNLNHELGTTYGLFEYHGAQEASTVYVVFGSPEAAIAKLVVEQMSTSGEKIGLVNVRVYRPFGEEEFLGLLPDSTKRVAVLGQVYDSDDVHDSSATSILYSDVLGALAMSDKWASKRPTVIDLKYTREVQWRAGNMASLLKLATTNNVVDIASLDSSNVVNVGITAKQYVQWDLDTSASADVAEKLACIFAMDGKVNTSHFAEFDNYAQGGIQHSEIKISDQAAGASYAVEAASFALVTDSQILASYDVVETIHEAGTLILKHSWKAEETDKKLPANLKKSLLEKKIQLYLFNTAEMAEAFSSAPAESCASLLAAIKLFGSNISYDEVINKVALVYPEVSKDNIKSLMEGVEKALSKYEIPSESLDLPVDGTSLPCYVAANAFEANTEREDEVLENERSVWQTAAKHIAFKEAYEFQSSLRPDLVEKTWQVKVQANRRLTPGTYDRNIFHIEFDITGTDLKYALGESLGVHGHNDSVQTEAFLKWYGLDADELIRVPSLADPAIMETRTVFQALQQNVDLFGRPAKKFYEALAEYAEKEDEKKVLTSLSFPEGAVDFKRRAEVETVTYADLLEEFSSAHPPIEDLVKMIPATKRREYSISSSQKVHSNSVHLLVVVVDWKDQRDRERFGQCTRYLSRLEIGDKVTVSLKPSVMKLPPRADQPIIMAGLGTGLAPFRAFVEERAWQKAQGEKIGAVMLYLGSRHQKEEYLYGEEWEAYRDAGIITTLGQAFSRDQPKKVYIQDVMRSTIIDIRTALITQEGSFYLCGPTWPVPDVQEVLEEAIRTHAEAEGRKVESSKVIEDLKESRRYVLEVY